MAKRVLIFGSGKQAQACAHDLVKNPFITQLTIVDIDQEALDKLQKKLACTHVVVQQMDFKQLPDVKHILLGQNLVISCAPYQFNSNLCAETIAAGAHYIDLGGSVEVRKRQQSLHEVAKSKGILVVPDSGLAPGLVSVLTKKLVEDLDMVDSIRLRVGGLPANPDINMLKYAQVFSITGLVNEYIEHCEVLRDGKVMFVDGMSELEEVSINGFNNTFEAFTTSGGSSTLPEFYKDKVRNLDYKTIRYKGHHQLIKFLQDLGLTRDRLDGSMVNTPRQILEERLSRYLPTDVTDIVIVKVEADGVRNGKKVTIGYELFDKGGVDGLTAMQRTTAFPTTILAGLILDGTIKERGVLTQEHFVPSHKIIGGLKERGIRINIYGAQAAE